MQTHYAIPDGMHAAGLGIGIFPADPCHAGVAGRVTFPEAAEGKRRLYRLGAWIRRILPPFQDHFLADLMRNTQTIQCDRVQRRLAGRLRHPSGCRRREAVRRVAVIRPADLDLPSAQAAVFGDAEYDALSQLLHIRVRGQLLSLFRGNVLTACLGVIAGLPEGHSDQVLAHAPRQGKQCREHEGGHQDRQYGCYVARSVILECPPADHPDGVEIFLFSVYYHGSDLLTVLRCVRLHCGRCVCLRCGRSGRPRDERSGRPRDGRYGLPSARSPGCG